MHSQAEIIRLLFQYFNERNWDAAAELYHDKVAVLHPYLKDCFIEKSKWNMPHRYAALVRKYNEVREEIIYINAAGNQVFVHYQTCGLYANGLPFQLPAWSIYTLQDGRIIKDASYISTPQTLAA